MIDGTITITILLGVLASVVAAFVFPVINDLLVAVVARVFGWLPLGRKRSLSGQWKAAWTVESDRYEPRVVDHEVVVRQVGKRIYAKFRDGNMDCYLVGTIESGIITGKWYNEQVNGYHGAFQFIIDPRGNRFSGKWIGFSTSRIVKHGDWEWEKKSTPLAADGPA